jgi:hypothetical protein
MVPDVVQIGVFYKTPQIKAVDITIKILIVLKELNHILRDNFL